MKGTQIVVYRAEIKALKANGKVALGSELVHQDPHLTEDGLMEARGRISPYLDWNFLTILPEHDLAKLVVKDTHKRVLRHMGGINWLTIKVAKKFWIPKLRTLAK